jgi:DNA-binding FrmR family transcriptional regulator
MTKSIVLSTITSYVKEATAILKGDAQKRILAQNQRIGINAIQGQISSLKNLEIQQEIECEDSVESYNNTLLGISINAEGEATVRQLNADQYPIDIINSLRAMEAASETLAKTRKGIETFENLLKSEAK